VGKSKKTEPERKSPQAAKLLPPLFFYLTAALSGAVIMIIEILGANMLAPYVGMSHFVWSAQITVTLFSLALGYYVGGLLADRTRDLSFLYGGISVAAIYLIIPAAFRGGVASMFMGYSLAITALLISFVLFFIPLALLAAVGPFLVRFITETLDSVSGKVGLLISIGTVGSLAGTLIISYLLVPYLSQTTSMYLSAALLLIPSSVYFALFAGKGKKLYGIIFLGIYILLISIMQSSSGTAATYRVTKEIFRQETHYGLIQVLEGNHKHWRALLTDFLVQNQYSLTKKQSMSTPTYLLQALAAGYAEKIDSALCIGLGAGILPGQLSREGVRTDVVEINEAIVDVAARYFDFNPGSITLTIDDARHYLQVSKKRYRVIFLDAFLNDGALFHLMTREAFATMRERLEQDGILVINTLGDVNAEKDYLTASVFRTLNGVFPYVRVHALPDGRGGIFFVASSRPLKDVIPLPEPDTVHPVCRQDVTAVLNHRITPEAVYGTVLTDDYNPGAYYDASRRESLRRHFYHQLQNL